MMVGGTQVCVCVFDLQDWSRLLNKLLICFNFKVTVIYDWFFGLCYMKSATLILICDMNMFFWWRDPNFALKKKKSGDTYEIHFESFSFGNRQLKYIYLMLQ